MFRRKFLSLAGSLALVGVLDTSAYAGDITDQMAFRTLRKWMPSASNIKVYGVRPENGYFVADFHFDNALFQRPKNDAVTAYAFGQGGGTYRASGDGEAVFSRYTNGTWILIGVKIGQSVWRNLRVTAE